jgi:hypothetical protein
LNWKKTRFFVRLCLVKGPPSLLSKLWANPYSGHPRHSSRYSEPDSPFTPLSLSPAFFSCLVVINSLYISTLFRSMMARRCSCSMCIYVPQERTIDKRHSSIGVDSTPDLYWD